MSLRDGRTYQINGLFAPSSFWGGGFRFGHPARPTQKIRRLYDTNGMGKSCGAMLGEVLGEVLGEALFRFRLQ
jgi:hypothetical protein